MKLPVPVPSIVLEFAMVGAPVVFQQTPRAVMVKPPSSITLPPEVAEVAEIFVTGDVVIAGPGKARLREAILEWM